jgi:hypothetical protein
LPLSSTTGELIDLELKLKAAKLDGVCGLPERFCRSGVGSGGADVVGTISVGEYESTEGFAERGRGGTGGRFENEG